MLRGGGKHYANPRSSISNASMQEESMPMNNNVPVNSSRFQLLKSEDINSFLC
jgi:hypothetical protein